MNRLVAIFVFLLPALAVAEPGTYTITPTTLSEDGTGGSVDGFRLYEGCDLAAQTKGALVADNVLAANSYILAGDTATPPVVCAVAYNSAGEGGFANTVTLEAVQQVPGTTIIDLTCEFVADSGEVFNCSGVVQ